MRDNESHNLPLILISRIIYDVMSISTNFYNYLSFLLPTNTSDPRVPVERGLVHDEGGKEEDIVHLPFLHSKGVDDMVFHERTCRLKFFLRRGFSLES